MLFYLQYLFVSCCLVQIGLVLCFYPTETVKILDLRGRPIKNMAAELTFDFSIETLGKCVCSVLVTCVVLRAKSVTSLTGWVCVCVCRQGI